MDIKELCDYIQEILQKTDLLLSETWLPCSRSPPQQRHDFITPRCKIGISRENKRKCTALYWMRVDSLPIMSGLWLTTRSVKK